VRVTNAADSTTSQFQVRWAASGEEPGQDSAMAVHVPPGHSRVLRMRQPGAEGPAQRLVLSGDRAAFDNTFYVVPRLPHQSTVLYVGGDADDDPHGLHYYLRQALHGNPRRTVNLQACRGDQLPPWSDEPPQLVVVTEALPKDSTDRLTQYLQGGGMAVLVPRNQEAAVSLVSFDQHLVVHPEDNSARGGGYAMLGQIDFTHPLFSAFANRNQ
jgi:hypothetical protein